MVLTFKCEKCKKRKFFETFENINNKKNTTVCLNCINDLRNERKRREEDYKKYLERKKKKKKEARKLSDEILLERVKMEKRRAFEKGLKTIINKQKKVKETKVEKNQILKKRNYGSLKKQELFMSDQMIEQMIDFYDPLLYIRVTVKRIKAIEWRSKKKKILLNKEREIRHTHKGGWSQEKFQRFVDSQKKKAPEWIEQNLTKEGVLRPHYEKIIIESDDEELKSVTRNVVEKINSI